MQVESSIKTRDHFYDFIGYSALRDSACLKRDVKSASRVEGLQHTVIWRFLVGTRVGHQRAIRGHRALLDNLS